VPIYEYKCENGHVFDVMQKMADEPLTKCIECGALCTRVLTAPAIHFKGSGFYATDYGKRKAPSNGGGEGGGDGGGGGGDGGGGGESKSSDSGSSDSSSSSESTSTASSTAD
jgi:putative FmdB family regulatory protein